jgi:hypothetical protein
VNTHLKGQALDQPQPPALRQNADDKF